MNSGRLNGYRTPGGHRRILREELLRFIKNNHLEDCLKLSQVKRVLIVEDDEDAMDLYISILEKDNYEIKKSYTGFSSGVAIDFKPDLMILDIMLPDLDGFKICDFIRKSPETGHTKILVISAISEIKKIRKMYDLGANDYLVKPFSIMELKNKIRKLLYAQEENAKETVLVR
jgi:DNA-binding response OmpR family regulator